MSKYLVGIVVGVLGVGGWGVCWGEGEASNVEHSTVKGEGAASRPATRGSGLVGTGLVRVGNFYLLEGDAGLAGMLKEVRGAKRKLDEGAARRAGLEGKIEQANDAIAGWYRQLRGVNEEEKKQEGSRVGRLPEQNNILVGKIKEGERLRDQWVKERDGLGDASGAYAAAVIKASDAMEGMVKRYAELAGDEGVKGAIAGLNGKGRGVVRLGPSGQFQQELKPMRKLREGVDSGVVKMEMGSGVPQVRVSVNGEGEEEMVVDSGASSMVITAALAKRLGVEPRPGDPEVEMVVANGEHVTGREVRLGTVRVGVFTVGDVRCVVLPKKAKGENLLGGTFLRNFVYRMDLGAGELHLTQVSGRPAGLVAATTRPASEPAYWAAGDWMKHMVGDVGNRDGEAIVLKAGERISTDKWFVPPVRFRVQARTDGTNLRLRYGCDQMIFNWEMNPKQFRIDGGPVGGSTRVGGRGWCRWGSGWRSRWR